MKISNSANYDEIPKISSYKPAEELNETKQQESRESSTNSENAAVVDINFQKMTSIAQFNMEASQNDEFSKAEEILKKLKTTISGDISGEVLKSSDLSADRVYKLLSE